MFWKQRAAIRIRELLAGVLIGIGGMVFLACNTDNPYVGKYVGAVLFAVALSSILLFRLNLYTGMVGYLPEQNGVYAYDTLASILWNFAGAFLVGFLRQPMSNVRDLCLARLDKSVPQVLIDAFLCGILIFICVDVYKKKNRLIAVFLCVPTFILCGFEHSIADAFYFANARLLADWRSVLFLLLVVVGNAAGGLLIPLLLKLASALERPKEKAPDSEPSSENNSSSEQQG
ncbi:MAG: formate/nitrite transporter family protein [Clostridia bacterium]|nr:formate/nitrite transporter family protein [Clostridia bacterium]